MCSCAHRLCIDFLRQRYGCTPNTSPPQTERGTRKRLVDSSAVDVGEVPNLHETSARRDEQLLRRDLDGAVQACLARFTPAQCVLLAMRDDLPVREIAKVLRYPSPFHVYRTLNSLLGGCAAVWPNEELPGVDAAGVVHHQAPTGHGPVVGRWGGASSMASGIFMAVRR